MACRHARAMWVLTRAAAADDGLANALRRVSFRFRFASSGQAHQVPLNLGIGAPHGPQTLGNFAELLLGVGKSHTTHARYRMVTR